MSTWEEFKPFNDQDTQFILDILNFHPEKDRILKGMEYITCGKYTPNNYTKAFFAIGKDDKKDDFVVAKCIEKIGILDKKKLKQQKEEKDTVHGSSLGKH